MNDPLRGGKLCNMETAFPPGEHFHYSNVGYETLGVLLEELLGQPYGEVIQSGILNLLGMAARLLRVRPVRQPLDQWQHLVTAGHGLATPQ